MSVNITSPTAGKVFYLKPNLSIPVSGSASTPHVSNDKNEIIRHLESLSVKLGNQTVAASITRNEEGTFATWSAMTNVSTLGTFTITATGTVHVTETDFGNFPGGDSTAHYTQYPDDTVSVTVAKDETDPTLVAKFSNNSNIMEKECGAPGTQVEFSLSGTASDAQTGIAKVQVARSGTAYQDATTDTNWDNWTAKVNVPSQPGDYTIYVKAIDNASVANTTVATLTARLLDTTAPTLTATFSNNQALMVKNCGAPDTQVEFDLSGTASDAHSSISKVEVGLLNGTFQNATPTAPSPNTWAAWTAKVNVPSQPGDHSVVVRALDAANNKKEVTLTARLLDATAPALTAVFSNNQTLMEKECTAPGTQVSFSLSGTASDANGTISKVEVGLDGTFTNASTSNNYAVWTATVNIPAQLGDRTIVVRAWDNNNNKTELNLTARLVDKTAPLLTAAFPGNKSLAEFPSPDPANPSSNVVPVSLSGIAGDAVSGLAKVEVGYNSVFQNAQTNNNFAAWTASVNLPAQLGDHAILVRALDNAGNKKEVTLTARLVDKTPPLVTFDTPSSLVHDDVPLPIHLTGTVKDVQSGVSWVKVSLTGGGGVLDSVEATLLDPHGPNQEARWSAMVVADGAGTFSAVLEVASPSAPYMKFSTSVFTVTVAPMPAPVP